MRSSIACSRCRRSKVKCVNNGVNTTCRACENTGRECTYPAPAVTGGQAHHVRREGSSGRAVGSEGAPVADTPRRPRPKKALAPPPVTQNVHSPSSIRALVDALDTTLLTPKVWIELFDIYQQHFATDMPFLHPPTFLRPLRQANAAQQYDTTPGGAPVLPDLSPVLLLSFLALTARHHPVLIAHHSPPSSSRPSNPRIASEYYAAAAKSRLAGNLGDSLGTTDIERLQALLMLALFDWSNCQGAKAWISLGVALRYAQLLGLQYEDELDDQPRALSLKVKSEAAQIVPESGSWETTGKSDTFVEREVRRRIFWSCFIMDRYLSSGKYRPQMVQVQDVRIQLPSSERAFLFGERVRTLMLDEDANHPGRGGVDSLKRGSDMPYQNGERSWASSPMNRLPQFKQEDNATEAEKGRWEVGPDEGLTSRFVKVLDIYGKLVKWTCAGGRRIEHYPPWDSRSSFYQLRHMIRAFEESLPRDMTLSPANTSAHITGRTSTPYTMLHATLILCNMMLHREPLPFVALRCSKPVGPLDPPTFPPEQYSVPPNFWADSAAQLMKSARDLMDLVRTCQQWGVLVETPIVGFAIYTAAFVGVYAINFPWMDQHGYMSSGNEPRAISGGTEAARKALELIGQMRPRLKMADGWFRTISRTHTYYMKLKKDFRKNIRALAAHGNSVDQVHKELSLREGGAGGGGDAWQLIQRTMIEFGSLKDDDLEMEDAPPLAANGQNADTQSQRHSGSPDSGAVQQGGWASINANPNGHRPSENNSMGTQPVTNGYGNSTPNASKPNVLSPTGGYASNNTGSTAFNRDTIGYASVEDARNASMNLQQQVSLTQHPPLPPIQEPWTKKMEEDWLDGLQTSFGGDDLAAFVEGFEWSEWPDLAATQHNGTWLSTVWS